MHHFITRPVAAAAGFLLVALPALAGEPMTIAQFAPKDAVMVAGIDDAKSMWEAFDRGGFRKVWDDPAFKKWFETTSKESMDEFAGDLDELGLKMEDFKRPTGPFGLAAWFEKTDDGSFDSVAPPGVFMMAHYGEDAQPMDELITQALERAQDKKRLEFSESNHNGVTIYTYSFAKPEEPELDEMGDPIDGAGSYKEMHYARADDVLLVTSSMDMMERSIDRVKGDDAPAIASGEDFEAARKQLGDHHGYAVVLGEVGRNWTKSMIEESPEMLPIPALGEMFPVLGLEDIRGAGIGFRLESDDAVLEQSYGVLASKKSGLLQLFEAPSMSFTPPAFVGAGTASVTLMQFNFNGVIPLINQAIAKLPEELRGQIEGQVMGVSMMAGPLLASLGPEVCIVQDYKRPYSPASQQQIWAIKARDAAQLQQTLAGIMPSIGMVSRDFQGNQIWSPNPAGGMLPPDALAIGLGFGHVIVGPPQGVEDLMRQGGAADNPKLADDPAFKLAIRPLTAQGLGYSFSSMKQSLDWFDWSAKNFDKLLEEQMKIQFGDQEPADDEERQWRKEAMDAAREATPAWMRNPPPLDAVHANIGDVVTEFKSTADGFTGRSLILRPKK